MSEQKVPIDKVVAAYIKLRDAKGEMAKRHKEEMEPITNRMDQIENALQKYLLDHNLESMKTEAGTAFLQTATTATVRDWNAVLEFVRAKGEWSMLEARVNKTAVKDFIETEGEVPPGVEFSSVVVTRVRR